MNTHESQTLTISPDVSPGTRHYAVQREPLIFPGGDFQTVCAGLMPRGYPRGLPRPRMIDIRVDREAQLRVELTVHQPDSPLVLMIHGFTGHANSPVMLRALREAYRRGYSVARLNLRNAGGTHGLTKGLFNLLQWRDIGLVLEGLSAMLSPSRLYAMGFSVGGNLLLNQLAREPRYSRLLRAAVALNPPIDVPLSAATVCLPRNWVYMGAFVRSLIATVRGKRSLGEAYPDPEAPIVKTVPEFDRRFILAEVGLASPEEYYTAASSKDHLGEITVPTLLLASEDDPIVPVRMFHRLTNRSSKVELRIAKRGGHLGFFYWNRCRLGFWAAEVALDFFDEQ